MKLPRATTPSPDRSNLPTSELEYCDVTSATRAVGSAHCQKFVADLGGKAEVPVPFHRLNQRRH